MSLRVLMFFFGMYVVSCTQKNEPGVKNLESANDPDPIGTWKLHSSQIIVDGDTTFKSYTGKIEGIKVINKTHFSFFQHDLNGGKDSLSSFVSGGGKYILKGSNYIEFLEYCSAREWENNRFEFEIAILGDTLIQTGVEKIESLDVDRVIIETYIRANELNTPVPIENEFEEGEISWFSDTGNGSIKGVAQFKSKTGEVKYGSQFRIELMPYTSYTEERLTKIYKESEEGSVFIQDGVPRFIPDPHGYHKTLQTLCDSEGQFEFNQLPEGEYYIIAFMIWDEKVNEQKVLNGGGIMRRVSLSEGQMMRVEMLNFNDE